MNQTWKRARPYAESAVGVAVVTAAVALLRNWVDVPNLAVAYLLLVLWLGSRWGSPPAAVAALTAFLAYDFFFVPPVGTLAVSAPRELVNLVVLLAGALAGGQLAARLGISRTHAEAAAASAAALYEISIAALRVEDAGDALRLVCERGARLAAVGALSVVGVSPAGADTELIAGAALTTEQIRQALWCHQNRTPLGLRLSAGNLTVMRSFPDTAGPAYLPLTGGVLVVGLEATPGRTELQLLAALAAMAGLLLDRRRAGLEEDRIRGLEASDSLKTAVLSSLSHELKSPLATLRLGLSSLSMPESGLGEEERALLSGLDRQAARLDRLVGDLLAMSRLEAGVGLFRSPSSYAELVGAVVERMRTELQPFRIRLELARDLPAALLDELQTDRVITNLLLNAVEWTPPGGTITLGAAPVGDRLRAWVENDGPEIAVGDLDLIFDKFWTGRTHGSGLGLAIAKRAVEAHGGSISVQNRRRGPRFTFELPLAKVTAGR